MQKEENDLRDRTKAFALRIVRMFSALPKTHGPALFREFQLMKEAGLTNMQILRCATSNAAQMFGGETGARIGKMEQNALADLVILTANPVDDISNTSKIDTVVKNGTIYRAASLLPDAAAK